MDRPNILLLTIDTLRTDLLGCYGSEEGLTPAIDRLAEKSILFQNAITGGSWTQAAFPVMLTSTYASMYGGCLGPLSPDRPSPIEALAKHGYQTMGFSTSPLLSRRYGYDRGFQQFIELNPDETDPFIRRVKGGETLLHQPLFHRLLRPAGIRSRPARTYVSGEKLVAEVSRAVQGCDEPFFIWAHFMDTHWPYHIEESIESPDEIAQAWIDLITMHRVNRKGRHLTAEFRNRFLSLYKIALRYTDAVLGNLLASLEEQGIAKNTVVILVSDHGEEFMERQFWGHFEINLFDEIIRVPLIIHIPEYETGSVIDRQVRLLDLMPSILDLGACPVPPGVDGISFSPLWDGHPKDYPELEAISEMWRTERHMIAVRTPDHKYIWDSSQPDFPRLFDLSEDPDELTNISNDQVELTTHYQSIVDGFLTRKDQSGLIQQEPILETDPEVLRRLRDLGYID